jgi:rubrerythrin
MSPTAATSATDKEHHLKKPQLFQGQPVLAFDTEESRRKFLRGAAVIGVGSTLAIHYKGDPLALAQDASKGDLEILNYALTLEYLEAEFYEKALSNGVVSGRARELVEPIRDHEQAHVDLLTKTINDLGGTPVEKPTFKFPKKVLNQRAAFLETASIFEELGVTAYQGQVMNIDSPDLLAAAASIAGVESRHAAVIAVLMDGEPFPSTTESSASMDEVLEAAAPFIEG